MCTGGGGVCKHGDRRNWVSSQEGHPPWGFKTGSVLWLEEQGRLPEAVGLAMEGKGWIRFYQLEMAEGWVPVGGQTGWEVGAP